MKGRRRSTPVPSPEAAEDPIAVRHDILRERSVAAREVKITLHAKLFLRTALGCVAILSGLGLLVAYLDHVRDGGLPRLILRGFLLDAEANVPTFFAFSLLVFCAVLLALIGACAFLARHRERFHWTLLGALFFLVGFDEAARLHEKLNEPVRAALGGSGMAHFPWVIPAGGLVAVLALLYLPLLRGLPAPIGPLFVLSAALFVGGALGVEMLGAAYAEKHGIQAFGYRLLTTVEESLEMLGVTVFAYALMRFLAHQVRDVHLAFR